MTTVSDGIDTQGQTRDDDFREHILLSLSTAAQAQDSGQIQELSTHVLRELYPHIWQLGPRGEHYVAQLDRIETILDEMVDGQREDDFLHDFCRTFENLAQVIDKPTSFRSDFAALTAHVHRDATDQHYLNVNLGWIGDNQREEDEQDIADVTRYVSRHIYWDQADVDRDYMGWYEALETFTYLSLFMPLILTFSRSIRHPVNTYTTFCTRWDILP